MNNIVNKFKEKEFWFLKNIAVSIVGQVYRLLLHL